MFASALQKRKAVVALAQPRPQPQSAQTQASLSTQAEQHAPAVAVASSQGAVSSRETTATAAWPSLSDMLSKKQRTGPREASQSSAFTTARDWKSHDQPPRQQRTQHKPNETAASAHKRVAPARSKAATANDKARERQRGGDGGEEQESVVFDLSNKRRVTVRKWRAAVLIDIREYYDADGVSKPGKKGISLSKEQWRALQGLVHAIDEAIILVEDDSVDEHSLQHVEARVAADSSERTISFTLSSKRRVSVRFFRSGVLVDLREFYDQDGVQKPGKKGISLSKEQWRALCGAQQAVSEAASQL